MNVLKKIEVCVTEATSQFTEDLEAMLSTESAIRLELLNTVSIIVMEERFIMIKHYYTLLSISPLSIFEVCTVYSHCR